MLCIIYNFIKLIILSYINI